MNEISIILDNNGNDQYAQTSRDFLTSPITASNLKILLSNEDQLNNVIKVRNSKSYGSESNRDISLRNYVSAMARTNLILDIELTTPIILDGSTYFETELEANSEMDLLFYFDQVEVGDVLK
jgi:hypothetical protein